MKFAIIAAGEGSRLVQEGVSLPKPLVRIGTESMIDRLMNIFRRQGATEIVLIVNERMPEVVTHVKKRQQEMAQEGFPLRIVVKSTPSSMHSFYELSPYLEGEPFCLTTVDTIFREEDFKVYIQEFLQANTGSSVQTDGLMAVTGFVDDEKPLYVLTDEDMYIRGFYDDPPVSAPLVSGGIYLLSPPALTTLRQCISEGKSKMRNFQRQLVADGLRLKAYVFPKILDVDHASDIQKAEAFLKEGI